MRGCSCRGTAGFAHVSCLAEQAKILIAEAEENNLGGKAMVKRLGRWYECSLCEQGYHSAVRCALGWACWKTYVGRPETDSLRQIAMRVLGIGLCTAGHKENALTVQQAELSMRRRLGASEDQMLVVQTNLAATYEMLGRLDEALSLQRDVYSGRLKLSGEEHRSTLLAANNYAMTLNTLKRRGEVKSLLRKTMPVVRRILGENDATTLTTRSIYADALFRDAAATLDDLREAVTTFEDAARIARRVLGGAHPLTTGIEAEIRDARAALNAREETGGA